MGVRANRAAAKGAKEAAEARMRFEVLGPLRVRRGGAVLSLGGPKPRALLGVLLLHPREPVGIDELTESLCDGEPPASASANLRAYVWTLRKALTAVDNGEARRAWRPRRPAT